MYNYYIYNQLQKYKGIRKSFHVPGHKAKGEFAKFFKDADMDITELSYSDNLACPESIIAAAQNDIAEILGARASYILTDGSTSGILTLLYAASRRGNKIIIPRNAHQSVWNGCKVLGLEPVVVQGGADNGVILPPDAEQLERLLVNDVSIAGMLVTHPDYYGNFAPLADYAIILKRYSRLLLVDEAHGAHLAFEPEKRGYAGVYADAWVDGAHKTLATLTQGAILSVNNEKILSDIEEGLNIFRTSSPSYPIMASVEYGVKYMKNNRRILERAKLAAAEFAIKAGAFKFYPSDDWTKICVDMRPLKISADEAQKVLEKKGIYCEFSDGRYLVFYISSQITKRDMTELRAALFKVATNKKLQNSYIPRQAVPVSPRTYSYLYANKQPNELLPLKQAVGRMSARNVGITPPCIPIIVAGETITEQAVAKLTAAHSTFGIVNGEIKVVKQ